MVISLRRTSISFLVGGKPVKNLAADSLRRASFIFCASQKAINASYFDQGLSLSIRKPLLE